MRFHCTRVHHSHHCYIVSATTFTSSSHPRHTQEFVIYLNPRYVKLGSQLSFHPQPSPSPLLSHIYLVPLLSLPLVNLVCRVPRPHHSSFHKASRISAWISDMTINSGKVILNLNLLRIFNCDRKFNLQIFDLVYYL